MLKWLVSILASYNSQSYLHAFVFMVVIKCTGAMVITVLILTTKHAFLLCLVEHGPIRTHTDVRLRTVTWHVDTHLSGGTNGRVAARVVSWNKNNIFNFHTSTTVTKRLVKTHWSHFKNQTINLSPYNKFPFSQYNKFNVLS